MTHKIEGKEWILLRAKIKKKFAKLTLADIDGLNGHMDRLRSKIQKVYSYDKGKAELECKAFNESLKK